MPSLLIGVPILLYLLLLLVSLRGTHRPASSDREYFLADRSLHWFPAMLSLIATETSVATIVIFPAAGFGAGFALLWLGIGYLCGRGLVAAGFLPVLYHCPELSLYAWMGRDSQAAHRIVSSCYLLAKFLSGGVRLFLAGYALSQLFGLPSAAWILITAVIVGAYSLWGGLRAVVRTDQLQGYIIFGVGGYLLWHLYTVVGHWPDPLQWINTALVADNALAWPALLLGGAVLSIGSHGADQDLLQRILATRSLRAAQAAMVLSSLGTLLILGIFVGIGVLLGDLHPGLDPKSPLPAYIAGVGAPLLQGTFAVLLLAAAMSTLDSAMHSSGAVWKALLTSSRRPGWHWSLVSLCSLVAVAMASLWMQSASTDFLALAMGSMNYIYGGLIGILLVVRTGRQPTAAGIGAAFAASVVTTALCSWVASPPLAWSWTILVSTGLATLCCYGLTATMGSNTASDAPAAWRTGTKN